MIEHLLNQQWLADDVTEPETKAAESFVELAKENLPLAERMFALPWLADGVTEAESQAAESLVELAKENSPLAERVLVLTWVQDGIEEAEAGVVRDLVILADESTEVGISVLRLPWVQDGIEEAEAGVVRDLVILADESTEVGLSVLGLSWVQDDISGNEQIALGEIRALAQLDPSLALRMAALPWLSDGVTRNEYLAVQYTRAFHQIDPSLALRVAGLPWFSDGIEEVEARVIRDLVILADKSTEVLPSLLGLPWIEDGIVPLDAHAVRSLRFLGSEASRIVDMQFLETLETPDATALGSLSGLASTRQEDFQRVMSHPTLSNGISDYWAKIITVFASVSDTNPALIDTLLDPNQVALQERVIHLPLSGETLLVIIRTGQGSQRSMDLLDHAVRHAEEYMGLPLPTDYVAWFFVDFRRAYAAGINHFTHIVTLPKYDIYDGSAQTNFVGSHIAHEVAHYYWRHSSNWVDEGIANFIASLSKNVRIGRSVGVMDRPCGFASTIAELEDIAPYKGDPAYICNYSLGERLFLDPYQNIGYAKFRQGLRELYSLPPGEYASIEQVKTAFKTVPDVEASVVNEIVSRWYGKRGQ